MSTKVDFDAVSSGGYRGRLINWEKFCDGDAHELEQGVDFHGARVDSTRSAGLQWAERHGLKPRSVIVTPPGDDSHRQLAADLSDAGQEDFARRLLALVPRFVFQIVDGLSDEQIKLARQIQRAEATGEDRSPLLRRFRNPEGPDPVEARRRRVLSDDVLSDQASG